MNDLTVAQQQTLLFIHDYVAGHGCSPSLREIAQGLDISLSSVRQRVEYLVEKGALAKHKGKLVLVDAANPPTEEFPVETEEHRLPIIGSVAAGATSWAEEHVDGYVEFGKLLSPQADFALHVTGDSMNMAGILDGDMVLVESRAEAIHGRIVVAELNGECTVKRYRQDESGPCLYPESTNPMYAPIPVTEDCHSFSILGHVLSRVGSIA